MNAKQKALVEWMQNECVKAAHTEPVEAFREDASNRAEALRACLEQADKPPAVGLTDKERNAIEVARFFVAAHGGGKSFEVIDTLDAMLDSDPGEYVAVRREDLQHAANMLWGYHYRLQETVGQSDSSLPKQHAEKLERLLAPAIAKGGEQ
jgi:hypothetical protein